MPSASPAARPSPAPTRRNRMKRLWMAACLVLWGSAAMAAPIKVMLLDGASVEAYHDWRTGTAVMKRELQEAGFDVTVVTLPPSDGDFSNVHPDFGKYQV